VENAFYADPRVLEVAAVGVPDGRLGEVVAAVVYLRPGCCGQGEDAREVVTEESLIEQAKQR
jgi:acyl-CoA synthetase (AMP-forming)/AMP-acid ligase II